MFDGTRAYHAARKNGWDRTESREAAAALKAMGGFGALKAAMNFARSGASSSSLGYPTWWPGKLTDPWPLRTGQAGQGNLPEADYGRNGTVQACLQWYQVNSTETRAVVLEGSGDDAVEQEGHACAALLAEPNPAYTAEVFWNKIYADLWVLGRGNAYVKKIRDSEGTVIQLWHIPAVQMRPYRGEGGEYLTGYRRTIDGKTAPEDPRDIIHFRLGQDPGDELLGFSPLYAVGREVALLNQAHDYRLTVLTNHGVPSYAVTPKDDTTARSLDKDKVDELSRIFVEKFTGQGRASEPWMLNYMAEITRIGFSPQELDVATMMDPCNAAVCGAMLLDPAIVGLPTMDKSLTYTNKEAARAAGFNNAIIPVQALLAGILTLSLLREFEPGKKNLSVAWDYSRVSALDGWRSQIAERNGNAVKLGWMAPNEARVRFGLKRLPGLDEPKPLLSPWDGWDGKGGVIAVAEATQEAMGGGGGGTLPGDPNYRPNEARGPGGTFAPTPAAANGNGANGKH